MRGVVVVAVLAACYAPTPPTGAPCATTATCPDGLVCSPASNTCEREAVPREDASLDDAIADAPIDVPAIDGPVSPFAYRRRITIRNNTNAALPVGHTIRVLVPTLPTLVSSTKVRADYADLRVIDSTPADLDRIVDPAGGPAPTAVSFALAKAIPAMGTSNDYALYYGNPMATSAPGNGGSVFQLYDTFASGIASFWVVGGAPMTSGGNLVLRANNVDVLTTTAATDNIPITSAIELVVRVVDPQSDPTPQSEGTFYYWFGYQRTGDTVATDPWAVWIARGKGAIKAEQKSPVGCETECVGTELAQNNGFHYYAIERDSNATRFYRDGTLSFTATVTNSTDYSVLVRNFMATSNVEVQYVRARARVTPEPTITLGVEETL